MNIIIVGGGQAVHFLTKSFVSKGFSVTIINNNKDYCRKLAKKHNATVVFGDGTKPYVLEDAGAAYSKLVISLTKSSAANLVICQIAKKIFKVEKTFAIVDDPKNIEIFRLLGVDTVISTAEIISSLIEQKVLIDDITNLIPIEEGKVAMMELEVKDEYPVANKLLNEIDIPNDAVVGCIIRNGNPVIPRGNTYVVPNDRLIILSLPSVQSKTILSIKGKLE